MKKLSGDNTRLAISITVFILLITLILDRLVPQGMFLDGVTYASISRNLAIGKGSFWAPIFRSDVFFAEHPPLMFGIESIFFKVLGDHYLVEKLYCFVVWLITVLLIRRLWNSIDDVKYSYILPVLMWSIVPTVTWAYTNNILDTTMAMFDLIAVIVLFKALRNSKNRTPLFILGALFTCCALLTKGPVGAFPLGIPMAYWLVYETKILKSFFRHIGYSVLITAIISLVFIALYLFTDAQINFDRYLDEQLFCAMEGRREITDDGLGRYQMFLDLAIMLIAPIAISIILFIIARLIKTPTKLNKTDKNIWFFLLVGLGGSLPILISVKQRGFYLLPALPYYVLAISLLVSPLFYQITEKLSSGHKRIKIFKIVAAIISIGLVLYLGSKVNQIGRDKEMISEINMMSQYLPTDETVGICNELENEYSFLSYIQRYNRVNVTGKLWGKQYVIVDTYLCERAFVNKIQELGYRKINTELNRYSIYKANFILMHFDFIQLNPVFRTRDKVQPSL